MYAYCNNKPVSRVDPNGEAFETAFDLISLGVSIVDVINNPYNPWAWAGLAGDVIDVAVPFITGVGEVTRAAKVAKETAEVVDDAHAALKTVSNVGDALPGACFIAGTLVSAEGGYKPIEDVAAGEYVWAWDEETGEVALKQVVETYIRESDQLVHIFVNGEEIITTPTHPFYSPVKGWTDAVNLRAGDILVLVNGEYVIVEKVQHEILEAPVTVYNFQVEDFHTYYVAESGVLVHNSCMIDNPILANTNPLENITYTDKVLHQATLDDFHGFPEAVDSFGAYGKCFDELGKDGLMYTHLEIPGSYKGYDGYFEYIWNSNKVCNHRLFRQLK